MKTYKPKSGLTLIELMVTIAAASLLALTVALVLIMAFRSWRMNNAFVDMRRDAALATGLISRDIRESAFEDVSIAGNQLTLAAHLPVRDAEVTYTKDGDSLNSTSFGLIVPSGVQAFTVQTNLSGDGVSFMLVLTNQYNITITREVFVNTRN